MLLQTNPALPESVLRVTGHFAPVFLSHLPHFKCDTPHSISHKAKQACFKCNIPCCLSHKPKQACFKYNISRSIVGGLSNWGEMT